MSRSFLLADTSATRTSGEILNYRLGCLKLLDFAEALVLSPIEWFLLQVDILLSRDLDSRISEREVAAVEEFLASDKQVHIMRDHPARTAPIMGGKNK